MKVTSSIHWLGECKNATTVDGKTRRYFQGVKSAGVLFIRGDVVELKAPVGTMRYIARIEDLWEESRTSKGRFTLKNCLTCRWFYRQSDLSASYLRKVRERKLRLADNEIFWTSHTDENTLDSVIQVAKVKVGKTAPISCDSASDIIFNYICRFELKGAGKTAKLVSLVPKSLDDIRSAAAKKLCISARTKAEGVLPAASKDFHLGDQPTRLAQRRRSLRAMKRARGKEKSEWDEKDDDAPTPNSQYSKTANIAGDEFATISGTAGKKSSMILNEDPSGESSEGHSKLKSRKGKSQREKSSLRKKRVVDLSDDHGALDTGNSVGKSAVGTVMADPVAGVQHVKCASLDASLSTQPAEGKGKEKRNLSKIGRRSFENIGPQNAYFLKEPNVSSCKENQIFGKGVRRVTSSSSSTMPEKVDAQPSNKEQHAPHLTKEERNVGNIVQMSPFNKRQGNKTSYHPRVGRKYQATNIPDCMPRGGDDDQNSEVNADKSMWSPRNGVMTLEQVNQYLREVEAQAAALGSPRCRPGSIVGVPLSAPPIFVRTDGKIVNSMLSNSDGCGRTSDRVIIGTVFRELDFMLSPSVSAAATGSNTVQVRPFGTYNPRRSKGAISVTDSSIQSSLDPSHTIFCARNRLRHVWSEETALLTLSACNYDARKALEHMRSSSDDPFALALKWDRTQRHRFLDGLREHNKDFPSIARMIPTRTNAEVVAHYYATKRLNGLSSCNFESVRCSRCERSVAESGEIFVLCAKYDVCKGAMCPSCWKTKFPAERMRESRLDGNYLCSLCSSEGGHSGSKTSASSSSTTKLAIKLHVLFSRENYLDCGDLTYLGLFRSDCYDGKNTKSGSGKVFGVKKRKDGRYRENETYKLTSVRPAKKAKSDRVNNTGDAERAALRLNIKRTKTKEAMLFLQQMWETFGRKSPEIYEYFIDILIQFKDKEIDPDFVVEFAKGLLKEDHPELYRLFTAFLPIRFLDKSVPDAR